MGSSDDSRTAVESLSFSPAKDASAGATRADGSTVDVDRSRPSSPRTRSSSRPPSRWPTPASEILKAAMGVSANEPLRWTRDLRVRPHGRAPADGRHGREPRQRPDDRGANGQAYRRKEVVLQETPGSFGASLSAAMGGSGDGSGGGVQVAGIVQDTAPLKRVYDPGHPDADAQGYVSMPNVDTVTEMVDLISARAPMRRTSRRCSRPSRCSPGRSIFSADADRSVHASRRKRARMEHRSGRVPRRRRRSTGSGFGDMLR